MKITFSRHQQEIKTYSPKHAPTKSASCSRSGETPSRDETLTEPFKFSRVVALRSGLKNTPHCLFSVIIELSSHKVNSQEGGTETRLYGSGGTGPIKSCKKWFHTNAKSILAEVKQKQPTKRVM